MSKLPQPVRDEPKTDIDFSQTFRHPIAANYKTALRFITTQPNYALQNFRKVVEAICLQIAQHYQTELVEGETFKQIDELYEAGFIHQSLRDTLHEARVLCNPAMHLTELETDEPADCSEQNTEALTDNARTVRDLVVGIFTDALIAMGRRREIFRFHKVQLKDQEEQEILFKALHSLDYRAKLEAGLVYEHAARMNIGKVITIPAYGVNFTSLLKTAGLYYEVAYRLSAHKLNASRLKNVSEEEILRRCDLESLTRYAKLATGEILGEKEAEEGWKLMKIAADRGHREACGEYGGHVLEALLDADKEAKEEADKAMEKSQKKNPKKTHKNKTSQAKNEVQTSSQKSKPLSDKQKIRARQVQQKYLVAKKYLLKAGEDAEAYRGLFYYFNTKSYPREEAKALDYLRKSVALGCHEAMMDLAQIYQEGELVKEDWNKAEQLIKQAAAKDNLIAIEYLYEDLPNHGRVRVEEDAEEVAIRELGKIGRNAPCPCKSGKKYKQCHGKPAQKAGLRTVMASLQRGDYRRLAD